VKPLFHITTRAAWDRSQAAREYRAPSLDSEGFIHLSTEEQWRHTLHRFFRGVDDVVVLRIDPRRVAAEIKYERAADVDEEFPHLYGPLETDAVINLRDAPRMVELPAGIVDRIKAADDAVSAIVACAIEDHGRPQTYVVLAARPGRAGEIDLPSAIAIGHELREVGWMQIHSMPRQPDGAVDEVALLAYVESLVQDD
jgi:uncharacterized protein (DUF952 family)